MKKIDLKIIKFLNSGKAYSDTAIMKNLGISLEDLKESYLRLESEGYLESYENYIKKINKISTSYCSHNCSNCENDIPEEYYHNIKVLTEKATKL